ncbi:DUF4163 domain-containing protein [Gorillibacterium massiliense]|uniref:DUF4163 domain-containing protein n=1 Tax=Gorillibacterium massiliense TaxID=1280390 RepID=UPI0004B37F50|nr:DUF4163 domain-containing protein [Gorillibacterium massiliense]
MNRNLLFATIATLFLLTGCGKAVPANIVKQNGQSPSMVAPTTTIASAISPTKTNATSALTQDSTATSKPSINAETKKTDSNFTIEKSNVTKNDDKLNYTINYPQISGLSDTDKQKMINSTLKNEALKVLNYYESPYGSVELNLDYEIVLKNPSLLSVQYRGLGSVSNAAHPNSLFFTTNLNIKTGEKLRLKDIVNLDEGFAYKFLHGEFKALFSEHNEALGNLTNGDILKDFTEADSLDNLGTENQSDVFSYFTSDSLGISISVGHAMGDHAEFEIKYEDIKDNILTEAEVWPVTASNNVKEETAANSFFFNRNISQIRYKAKFLFDDMVERDVVLKIKAINTLKDGILYELKLNPIEGVPDERLNLGYFYVQQDRIYKMDPTKDNLAKLKESEELPNGSAIVCQDKEKKDGLSENELGWHHYIDVKGDRREYHSYNNEVSTGFYESFTWEKGKGLIDYSSGYGAERDAIELLVND